MKKFRRFPQYSPATDGTLAIWLDGQDNATSSLTNTSDASPANGDTIKLWKSKAGSARNFQQSARSDARPTYDTSGINGHPALRFNPTPSVQILVADVVTGFQSMSGLTIAMAAKRNTDTGANNCGFGITIGTGTSLFLAEITDHQRVGGRRLVGDSFQFAAGNALSDGQSFIVTGRVDFSGAKLSLIESGVKSVTDQTFQTSGTTAASDPLSISIGARYESVLTQLQVDGWIGEVLVWTSLKTADELVGPHSYLRLRWGIS